MGDIVDGFNPPDRAHIALQKVIAEFDSLGKPHYHMLGNHCLYNLDRPVSPSCLLPNCRLWDASHAVRYLGLV